jgi:hypothetical protein
MKQLLDPSGYQAFYLYQRALSVRKIGERGIETSHSVFFLPLSFFSLQRKHIQQNSVSCTSTRSLFVESIPLLLGVSVFQGSRTGLGDTFDVGRFWRITMLTHYSKLAVGQAERFGG